MVGIQHRRMGFTMDYLKVLDVRFNYRVFHQVQSLWFMTVS